MERVIFCILECLTMLTPVPHTDLLEMDEGTVTLVEDSILLDILAKAPMIPILYFSRAAYDEAISGLDTNNVRNVIQKRRGEWAPKALDQTLDWIYRRERQCLTLSALSRVGGMPQATAVIGSHFRKTIELLSQIVGENRYDDVRVVDLLEIALENEALLIAEINATGADKPNVTESEIQERTQTVAILSRALAHMGRPQYETAPPYAELWRTVYISPADAALMSQLKTQYEPFVMWKKGLVARWRDRNLSALAKEGCRVEVLYYDRGGFLEDIQELVPAQLTEAFEKRVHPDNRARFRKDYLNALRLEAALLIQTIHGRSVTEEPGVSDRLGKILEIHTDRLNSTLEADGSWLAESVPAGSPALARLLRVEEDVVQDVVFFKGLCKQFGRNDQDQRLAGILQIKQHQLKAIKGLPKGHP